MNRSRRSRRIRARAVLRARRAGFLTPEAWQEATGALMELGPHVSRCTHARFTPLGGSDSVSVAALITVVLAARVKFRRLSRRRRRDGSDRGPGRMIGGVVQVEAALPSGSEWPESLEMLQRAPAVQLEAWSPLSADDDRWAMLTVPRVEVVQWGPGNVEIDADWTSFSLLEGSVRSGRPSGTQWRLSVLSPDPSLVGN